MTTFSPKANFQNYHPGELEELQKQCRSRWLSVAIDYALAHFAAGGAGPQELAGARKLIGILVNLGEKGEEMPKFPKHELALEGDQSAQDLINQLLKPKPKA